MGNGGQIPLTALFISAKRYQLSRPDGSFADYKESILGMLLPPADRWTEEAWRTLGEFWDSRQLTPRSWFALPAVRCLTMTSPAYAREIKGLPALRPWNFFLVATATGRKPGMEQQTAMVIAPFERDPEKWAGLDWRFAESGEPVPFDGPDSDGVRWSLRTLREFLENYARHPIAEMLAPDGSRCGPYTRGVLRRRPVRDGERWVVLKEAAVYGDNPRHAFSVPPPEMVRRPTNRDGATAAWESKIKPALAVVGPTAVARKMRLAERSVRAWAAEERQPENPAEVARAIVALAHRAGLGRPTDEHLRAEEICSELPRRAAAVQAFIVIATGMLVECHGGIRALARAMADQVGSDCESAVRRWLALAQSEARSIIHLNPIVARLAKFSRSEIRKSHRRIRSQSGPVGYQQAVLAHISLLRGSQKPVVPTPEETLALPVVLVLAGRLFALIRPIAKRLRTGEVHARSAPSALSSAG
jgi:hypothetical protein